MVEVTQQSLRAVPQTWLMSLLRTHSLFAAVLLVGVGFKALLLATGSVSFHSDEAILALMARHILQGEWPLFFYGQGYMGALDAYLIALGFLAFGQTVLAVRLVHLALYVGILVSTYVLAYRIRRDSRAAAAATLLMALPPVMVSLYTTASLGNYIVTLLLNNLIFLTGWRILSDPEAGWGRWLLLGVLAGLGWWGMALIVTSAVPVALVLAWHLRRRLPWRRVAVAGLGFVLGALPWLIGMALDLDMVLGDTFGTRISDAMELAGVDTGLAGRVLSLVVFNLPALFGLRPSWSAEWYLLPVGLIVCALYLAALWWAARTVRDRSQPLPDRRLLAMLLGGWGILVVAFLLSPFGIDPTGRYLLPLYPLLAVLTGLWLTTLATARRWLFPAVLALLVAYNLYGNVHAMLENPPGLTTQFGLISHLPHEYDDELIAFLDSLGVDRAYGNYWMAYRFAFLTHERLIIAPLLPYKADLSYTLLDDRYPAYSEAVQNAGKVVYITSNHPQLDDVLRARFAELGIEPRERQIGPYTVFYDLPRNVHPEELGALADAD